MPTTEHDPSTMWPVYEANVQAYRSLSISSQSILLAVGAILLDQDRPWWVMAGLAFLALILTWVVWSRVIYARVLIADFYKYRLDLKYRDDGSAAKAGANPANPLTEATYVQDRAKRKTINEAEDFRTMRLTRVKLDVVVPVVFSLIWVGFVVLSCF